MHQYVEVDRPATAGRDGTLCLQPRRWKEPLLVTESDERSGRINGPAAGGRRSLPASAADGSPWAVDRPCWP